MKVESSFHCHIAGYCCDRTAYSADIAKLTPLFATDKTPKCQYWQAIAQLKQSHFKPLN
ncbi:MAG: hypothetical protein AAFQ92_24995 [Bacteroidota bacterium]